MEKYFKMTEGSAVLNGVVINIPEGTDINIVKDRVEMIDGKNWVKMVDEILHDVDVSIDWTNIDNYDVVEEEACCGDACSSKKCKCGCNCQ